jgi:hypothetical protein
MRNLTTRQLFLIDSIGALSTMLLLSLVVARFEEFFGMPRTVCLSLAIPAFIFFVYSLSCYFRIGSAWRPYLRAISIANFSYCIASLVLIVYFSNRLTFWGLVYFVGEIVIVAVLATVEFRVSHREQ